MNEALRTPQHFTILVVDDEELLRDAVCFDFRRKGYNVLSAGCGRDALTVLDSANVDVVISDVRMPNGNGLELLEAIKKKNVFSPVVMFITGFADITLEEAYDLGADAVFPKPFDRKALQEAVERCLQPPENRFNRKAMRVEVKMDAMVRPVKDSEHAISRIHNLGRGGFFAEFSGKLPAVGEQIDFAITVEQAPQMIVSGRAIVRWGREAEKSPTEPRGCGMEFLSLDEKCRKPFVELLNVLKTKSFIPLK